MGKAAGRRSPCAHLAALREDERKRTRAYVLAEFIRKQRWKADAQRPMTEEKAREWDRDPIRQFMAMLGPSPKAKGRRTQPVKRSEE
jgi:hypothetical protein